jgi:hypothetical protein
MQKSDSTLVTDPERSDPYLIIEYEKNDVASNRVYEAIKRLELGAIQMRVVLRPVLLEQSRPNAASMERILNKTSL